MTSDSSGFFNVCFSWLVINDALKRLVFSDFNYRLLSDETLVRIKDMKGFDRHQGENLNLYNDFAYKISAADKAVDLGLYEEKMLKNDSVKRVKATGTPK